MVGCFLALCEEMSWAGIGKHKRTCLKGLTRRVIAPSSHLHVTTTAFPVLTHVPGKEISHSKMNMLSGDAKCAMRGSCGKKGLFGKPLPCPYDGPPVDVCTYPSNPFAPQLTAFLVRRKGTVIDTRYLWSGACRCSYMLYIRPIRDAP